VKICVPSLLYKDANKFFAHFAQYWFGNCLVDYASFGPKASRWGRISIRCRYCDIFIEERSSGRQIEAGRNSPYGVGPTPWGGLLWTWNDEWRMKIDEWWKSLRSIILKWQNSFIGRWTFDVGRSSVSFPIRLAVFSGQRLRLYELHLTNAEVGPVVVPNG